MPRRERNTTKGKTMDEKEGREAKTCGSSKGMTGKSNVWERAARIYVQQESSQRRRK
jgi:hypothetical protein